MMAVAECLFREFQPLGGAPAPCAEWPLLALTFPAERAGAAEAGLEQRLSLDAHLVRNPESTVLLRVMGEALRAAGIHDGDLLVLDRAAPATVGSLVLAAQAERFWLARIGRDADGRRVLYAIAAAGDDGTLPAPPDCHSVGVVRWVIHRLWPGRVAA